MMTKERDTNRWIKAAFKKHGANVLVYRPVPSVYGARFLDNVVCAYGYYIAVEAKRAGKDATDKQYLKLKQIEAAGGATFVIDTKEDVEELTEFLNWCARHPLSSKVLEWPTIPHREIKVI